MERSGVVGRFLRVRVLLRRLLAPIPTSTALSIGVLLALPVRTPSLIGNAIILLVWAEVSSLVQSLRRVALERRTQILNKGHLRGATIVDSLLLRERAAATKRVHCKL